MEKPATETPATSAPTPAPFKKCSGRLPVFVLLGPFLVGFVPMWIKSSRRNGALFRAQPQARVQTIQITFAGRRLRGLPPSHRPIGIPYPETQTMKILLPIGLALLLAAIVFSLQNASAVDVKFLVWKFSTSLALVIFATGAAGFIGGWAVSAAGRLRNNMRKK